MTEWPNKRIKELGCVVTGKTPPKIEPHYFDGEELFVSPKDMDWIKLAKPHFELLAVGATFAELTKGTFKRIEILTPPEPIVAEFARIESPLFKAIENLLRANQKLIGTRDKLLPRLISGKLSVENLDIQFPPGTVEEGGFTEQGKPV